MYSLFLDTHDKDVVVILYKDGKIVTKEDRVSSNKHSEILVPLVKEVMDRNNLSFKTLSLILVCNGPGSFTGARIAVTVAKTMAYCLDIPIKALDALTISAINIDSDVKCVALEDRNGAYVGRFDKLNKRLDDFIYMNKSSYEEFMKDNKVFSNVEID